ncbi:multiple C2 domain and transmembrane region protein 16 [Magnolia sinica]|uniref:multiple C2 domain and transmembrane region protein 16 n=1 Tax=Magnolia sinica TaxID=86752 RepID=UPI002658B540|nr:multiple C2 domain and transmembrane region protein 16 [Magnolia sinica]
MATVRKLIVEVVEARNLLPKDGSGSSSPYVVMDFYGQRKRTQTVHRDLNPTWNEVFEFQVDKDADLAVEALEIDVYHDKRVGPTGRNNLLGRVRLNASQFVRKGEEALVLYPLEKKHFWSWIQGDIGLRIYYVDELVPPPASPLPSPPEDAGKSDTPATPLPQAEDAGKPNMPEAEPPASVEPTPPTAEKSDAPPEANPPQPEVPPPPEAGKPEEPATDPPVETAPAPEPLLTPSENIPNAEPTQTQPESGAGNPPPPDLTSDTTMHGPDHKQKMTGFNGPRQNYRHPVSDIYPREAPDRFPGIPNERSSYDLVEKMHYLFVRVVKARSLPFDANPFVKITVSGCNVQTKIAQKTTLQFEWDQTFAFGRDAHGSASTLEVSVWDPRPGSAPTPTPPQEPGGGRDENFLGGICFDVSEIPLRDPPDSPLAPQWYRLEGGGAHRGDLMLATWIGTQADESFSEAWKTDTSGTVSSRAKVYLSPKLWYLRVTVLEAQDIQPLTPLKETAFSVKAQLEFQILKTRTAISRNGSPSWNEDLILVAAEPFGDLRVVFFLEHRSGKDTTVLGIAGIPLTTIERRVDDRRVVSRWITLDSPTKSRKDSYNGRLHVRVCFDGGYHVADEPAHVTSDLRPAARQLWKPPIGTVELGIVGCRNLLPVKTVGGRGTADAYAVAKYGEKWVRSRTVADSLDPRWNEQYTWHVYDPCTVLTVGVFNSVDESKDPARQDLRIGKIRIRISTLENNRVYKNTYPLLLLHPTGVKKMGEVELAVRFARVVPKLDVLHVYSQPMLPRMHYLKPIGTMQQESLRGMAARLVAQHLSRSEPPLRREVVLHMLDADSHAFSMRKVRANWHRIINMMGWAVEMARWVDDTRAWRNTTATLIAHVLLVLLVWHPDLMVPTIAFYTFVVGGWNYRARRRDPMPHPCVKISHAEAADREELDEEFDSIPSSRPPDTVRVRYDRLRTLGARVQTVLGDIATQGERMQALVTWRDPRATGIFITVCFLVSFVLYVVPSKMVAIVAGFYYLRHPMFRDRMPGPSLNFFRRLPSLSDRIM